jgi:voltage-gated potassium channel
MMRQARRLRHLVPAAALVVTLSGGGFAALETNTVGSFGEGVWWALSLVTTVGFVGQTPVTTGGRLLAAGLMLFGFALLSLTAAALASLFVREDETPAEQRDAAFESEVLGELRALHERLDRMEQMRSSDPLTRQASATS